MAHNKTTHMYFKEGISNLNGLSVERSIVRVRVNSGNDTNDLQVLDNIVKPSPQGRLFVLNWSAAAGLSVDPNTDNSMFDTVTYISSTNKNGPAPFCVSVAYPGQDKASWSGINLALKQLDVVFSGVVDMRCWGDPTTGISKGDLLYVTQPDATTGGTSVNANGTRYLCTSAGAAAGVRSSAPIGIALEAAPSAISAATATLIKIYFNGFKFIEL